MFGTENKGFCGLMKSIFGCIAIATEVKNGKIRTLNAKFAGKRLTQDEFIAIGSNHYRLYDKFLFFAHFAYFSASKWH